MNKDNNNSVGNLPIGNAAIDPLPKMIFVGLWNEKLCIFYTPLIQNILFFHFFQESFDLSFSSHSLE
jgi:hypothetical protein